MRPAVRLDVCPRGFVKRGRPIHDEQNVVPLRWSSPNRFVGDDPDRCGESVRGGQVLRDDTGGDVFPRLN